MPPRIKLKVSSEEEQDHAPQVATSSKKGKRSRQILDDDGSNSDRPPPTKRRTSAATARPRSHKEPEEDADQEVDIEGSDSDSPSRQARPTNDSDDDAADTNSSRSSSPGPTPRKQPAPKPSQASRSKPNRIESDEEDEASSDDQARSRSAETIKPPRPPTRQPTLTTRDPTPTGTAIKPLRKPVAGSKNKEKEKDAAASVLSGIPAIPRRPKDALAAVKDTQDMDLLNKDVYNQLFNTSSSSKPITKNVQNEAKQKEINAKRQAAKAALFQARESTFDLQLPTDKVLAFESRLRKLHRWYAPSALGFTYHEELRLRQRQARPQ